MPFAGNIIPASRIVNPVAKALFADPKLYPLPNQRGTGALGVDQNYVGSAANALQNDQADAKVDIRLTRQGQPLGTLVDQPLFPGRQRDGTSRPDGHRHQRPTTGAVVNWTRTISPTIVNEARIGYSARS